MTIVGNSVNVKLDLPPSYDFSFRFSTEKRSRAFMRAEYKVG